MKFLAIIPARGGSKGVPRKNLALLNGSPLIDYTIRAAKGSRYISEVFVSSDDEEILAHSGRLDVGVIRRPADLSADHSPTGPLIHHAINFLQEKGKRFDWVVLLQPTSPLRTSEDIDNAVETLIRAKANSLISVVDVGVSPYKSLLMEGGRLKGLVNDMAPFMRRQDCCTVYNANGAIYIYPAAHFLELDVFNLSNTAAYIMPAERSFDVDTLEDLKKIEGLINEKA